MTITQDGMGDIDLVRVALDGANGKDQALIAEAFVGAAALCLRKNSDYGSSAWTAPDLLPGCSARDAILVRMDDKWRRLIRLRELLDGGLSRSVEESFEDTLRDLANYALLWLACPEDR